MKGMEKGKRRTPWTLHHCSPLFFGDVDEAVQHILQVINGEESIIGIRYESNSEKEIPKDHPATKRRRRDEPGDRTNKF